MTLILPAHWRAMTLNTVCSSLTDGDHLAPPKAEQGVPFITISAMNDGNLNLEKATRFVHRSYYDSLSNDRCAKAGDILLSVTGSLGIAAPVVTDAPFVFQRHIAVLRPDQHTVDNQFLLYFLRSAETRKALAEGSTGTAQMTISLGALRRFPISVPTLAEQHRIVAQIDALFARTRRARADLERVASLARRLSETSIDVSLKSTAVNWISVGELATVVQYGSSAKTSDEVSGIPVLRMGNIVNGELNLGKLKYLPKNHPEFPSLLLEPGDILFNRTNSAELVGKTAVYTGDPEVCSFASYLIRLRIKGLRPHLFAAYINSPAGREWAASVVSQQVGQANINGTKLRAFLVPVMPEEMQAREEDRLVATRRAIRKIEADAARSLALLARFEQSILSRAFRGELVPKEPYVSGAIAGDLSIPPESSSIRRRSPQAA